jgi:hypothetical protein
MRKTIKWQLQHTVSNLYRSSALAKIPNEPVDPALGKGYTEKKLFPESLKNDSEFSRGSFSAALSPAALSRSLQLFHSSLSPLLSLFFRLRVFFLSSSSLAMMSMLNVT